MMLFPNQRSLMRLKTSYKYFLLRTIQNLKILVVCSILDQQARPATGLVVGKQAGVAHFSKPQYFLTCSDIEAGIFKRARSSLFELPSLRLLTGSYIEKFII